MQKGRLLIIIVGLMLVLVSCKSNDVEVKSEKETDQQIVSQDDKTEDTKDAAKSEEKDKSDSESDSKSEGSVEVVSTEDLEQPDVLSVEDMMEQGRSYMYKTYDQIVEEFGQPDDMTKQNNLTSISYEGGLYRFLFLTEGFNDDSLVGVVDIDLYTGLDLENEVMLDEFLDMTVGSSGYDLASFSEVSLINGTDPIAMFTDDKYNYLAMVYEGDTMGDVYIQECDFDVEATMLENEKAVYAVDYIGKSLGDLVDLYGEYYSVMVSEGYYTVMYFGIPYYFVFDMETPLTRDRELTMVEVEYGGLCFDGDPLLYLSKAEFIDGIGEDYFYYDDDDYEDILHIQARAIIGEITFDIGDGINYLVVTGVEEIGGYDGDIVNEDAISDHSPVMYAGTWLYFYDDGDNGGINQITLFDDGMFISDDFYLVGDEMSFNDEPDDPYMYSGNWAMTDGSLELYIDEVIYERYMVDNVLYSIDFVQLNNGVTINLVLEDIDPGMISVANTPYEYYEYEPANQEYIDGNPPAFDGDWDISNVEDQSTGSMVINHFDNYIYFSAILGKGDKTGEISGIAPITGAYSAEYIHNKVGSRDINPLNIVIELLEKGISVRTNASGTDLGFGMGVSIGNGK